MNILKLTSLYLMTVVIPSASLAWFEVTVNFRGFNEAVK